MLGYAVLIPGLLLALAYNLTRVMNILAQTVPRRDPGLRSA
jgi:hypothetical protein